MEWSSRNFSPGERKFWAKFASPNRHFTENSRWMSLTRTVKTNNRSNCSTLLHFLAVDLHDYNVKRPETSWFSRFMEEMWLGYKIRICSVILGENWIFLKITILFSRLINLKATVPSLP